MLWIWWVRLGILPDALGVQRRKRSQAVSYSVSPSNRSVENRAHEASLVAYETPGSLIMRHSGLAVRIGGSVGAVLLIGCQARKAEESERDVIGALVWQEVPMVRSTEFLD
jgi:hypothetical protein